jgi:hypothetical protein
MILSPYSNRGERIGACISVSEERERGALDYWGTEYLPPVGTEQVFML